MVFMHSIHSMIHAAALQDHSQEGKEDLWDSSDEEEDRDEELFDSSDEEEDSDEVYPEAHNSWQGHPNANGKKHRDDEEDCQVMEGTEGGGDYSDLKVCSSIHIVMRVDPSSSKELVELRELLFMLDSVF